jgi:hypothetical protein
MYFKQSDFFTGMAHGFVKDIMASMIGDRLLNCYRALSSSALLALHPTEGNGQVQETLEWA